MPCLYRSTLTLALTLPCFPKVAEEFAASIGAAYVLCSALTGANIDAIFTQLIERLKAQESATTEGETDGIKLTEGASNLLAGCC